GIARAACSALDLNPAASRYIVGHNLIERRSGRGAAAKIIPDRGDLAGGRARQLELISSHRDIRPRSVKGESMRAARIADDRAARSIISAIVQVRAACKDHGITVIKLIDAAQVRPPGKTAAGNGSLDRALHARTRTTDDQLGSRVPLEAESRVEAGSVQRDRSGKREASVKGTRDQDYI